MEKEKTGKIGSSFIEQVDPKWPGKCRFYSFLENGVTCFSQNGKNTSIHFVAFVAVFVPISSDKIWLSNDSIFTMVEISEGVMTTVH